MQGMDMEMFKNCCMLMAKMMECGHADYDDRWNADDVLHLLIRRRMEEARRDDWRASFNHGNRLGSVQAPVGHHQVPSASLSADCGSCAAGRR